MTGKARPGTSDISMPHNIKHAVGMAFRTAHLLTGSLQQAEDAVLEAIDHLDRDCDSREILLRDAISAAVRRPSMEPSSLESVEPAELRPVLGLSEPLRRCFVLRVLVGLSRPACSRLLQLHAEAVNDYTCAAVQRLADCGRQSSTPGRGEDHAVPALDARGRKPLARTQRQRSKRMKSRKTARLAGNSPNRS